MEEFKICPNCGKKFTKEECLKDKSPYATYGQKEFYWSRRVYCCYTCSYKFNAKKTLEKFKIKNRKNRLKFVAPVEVLDIDHGHIKKIKVFLYGQWIECFIQ